MHSFSRMHVRDSCILVVNHVHICHMLSCMIWKINFILFYSLPYNQGWALHIFFHRGLLWSMFAESHTYRCLWTILSPPPSGGYRNFKTVRRGPSVVELLGSKVCLYAPFIHTLCFVVRVENKVHIVNFDNGHT